MSDQPGPATIQVQRYRDREGNPTCARSFGDGTVCRFWLTNETCLFAKVDMDGKVGQLVRRGDGAGSFAPMPDCPLWQEGLTRLDPPPDIDAMFRELVKFLPGDYGAITVVYVGDCPEDIFVEVRAEWDADDPEVEAREFSGATIREALQATLSAMRAAVSNNTSAAGRGQSERKPQPVGAGPAEVSLSDGAADLGVSERAQADARARLERDLQWALNRVREAMG